MVDMVRRTRRKPYPSGWGSSLLMTGMEKLRFRWVVLGLAWLSWLLVGTAVLSIGAMLTVLIPQFGLNGVQAGTLMAVSWIAGIILAIPIGVLIDKYGGRKLGALGMLTLTIGLILFAYAETFELLVISRAIVGIAIITGTTPPQVWMAKWFSDDEIGFAQGFLTSGYASSGIVGVFAMGWIVTTIGIYTTVMILGALSLVLMIVFILASRELPTAALTATASNNSSVSLSEVVSQAFRNVELWKITIAWFAIVGISTAYATFAPITFVALLNMDIITAAALAGVVSIVAVPSLIAGGRLTDKRKDSGRRIMIWIPTLICTLAFYLIGISTALTIALLGVVPIGVFNWISSAAVYAAGAETVDSAMVGCAFGFLAFGAALGSLILPLLMGAVLDVTGSWTLTWAVPAVLAFIGAVVALFSKK